MRFKQSFNGRRVLVTGHTGFKGTWLCAWLKLLGADVFGIALTPNTEPNMFSLIDLEDDVDHNIIDIRNLKHLSKRIDLIQPEIVFHLAAQPLVRRSYQEPLNTFETNVMGTANILEALRVVADIKAFICITTDKVYHNSEQQNAYSEGDALGGKDPYSASKVAAEMIVNGYRGLFDGRSCPVALATARGGNVIGGGDWSEDRLVPDLVRALSVGDTLNIRNLNATRPWQHVLCLCHGYLALAEKLLNNPNDTNYSWNFGPSAADTVTVSAMLSQFGTKWDLPKISLHPETDMPESNFLMLDSSLAISELGWDPAWTLNRAVSMTAQWYKVQANNGDMRDLSQRQILQYNSDLMCDD